MRVVQMNPSSDAPKGRSSIPPPSPGTAKTPVSVQKPLIDIKSFKKDDWILLGIIAVLVLEGSDDYILLCALGYLFLMGL